MNDEQLAANLRACTLPPREATPAECRLRAQRDRGILTHGEYIDALNRLPRE